MHTAEKSRPSQFLSWWFSHLGAMLPQPVRWLFEGSHAKLLVTLGEETAEIEQVGPQGTRKLGTLPIESGTGDKVQTSIGRKLTSSKDAMLVLGKHQALHTQLRLPLSAAQELPNAIDAEISRVTPFAPENVVRDFQVTSVDQDTQTVIVDLLVVPKRELDRALRIARNLGLKLSAVTATASNGPLTALNLLPQEDRHQPRNVGSLLVKASVALAVLLGCAWAGVWYQSQRTSLAESTATLAQLRRDAAAAQASDQRGTDLLDAFNAIVAEKEGALTALSVLKEATTILPDTVWLNEFALTDGQIVLAGFSDNPTATLQIIEGADLFDGAEFTAPLRLDQQSKKEQFRARARVSGGAKEDR